MRALPWETSLRVIKISSERPGCLPGMMGIQSIDRPTIPIASLISLDLASYPAELASRCTNNRSNSDSAASAVWTFRANVDPRWYRWSGIELSGMADPTASVAPHDDSRRRSRTKRIVRTITERKKAQMAFVVSRHPAAAGSRTSSQDRALPLRCRARATCLPRGSIESRLPRLRRTASSFLSQSICHPVPVAGGDTGSEWRE